MKAVFYFREWFRLPRWGAGITEQGLFSKMVFGRYSNKLLIIADGSPAGKIDRSYDGFWGQFKRNRDCQIYQVVKPVGEPDTRFRIGRSTTHRQPAVITISPLILQVSDGLFAVRLEPRAYNLFAVGEKKVSLEDGGLVHRNSPAAEQKEYKKMKIY